MENFVVLMVLLMVSLQQLTLVSPSSSKDKRNENPGNTKACQESGSRSSRQPNGGWDYQCGCGLSTDGGWPYNWEVGSGPDGATVGFGSGSSQNMIGGGLGFGWGSSSPSNGGSSSSSNGGSSESFGVDSGSSGFGGSTSSGAIKNLPKGTPVFRA